MARFNFSDFQALTKFSSGPCVTIYMPNREAMPYSQQDAIRLSNLIDKAGDQLSTRWMSYQKSLEFIEPMRHIPKDHAFWQLRGRGLAIFLDHRGVRKFSIPFKIGEMVVVSPCFYLRLLLPLISEEDSFYILTISGTKIRLFHASEYRIDAVDLPNLRQHLDDVKTRREDNSTSPTLAFNPTHSQKTDLTPTPLDDFEGLPINDRNRLFRHFNDALMELLQGQNKPLILAGVESLIVGFRQSCQYPHIVSGKLLGNCDHLATHHLWKQALPLVRSSYAKNRHRAAEKCRNLAGTAHVTNNIQRTVAAALEGKIETLFIASDHHIWGKLDQGARLHHRVRRSGSDVIDLLDFAAAQTQLSLGSVYVVARDQVPLSQPFTALLRH